MPNQYKTHASMMPLSQLLHDTAAFLSDYFLELLFATALPLIISYILVWTALGKFINDFNLTQSWEQLVQLFSLANPSSIFAIAVVLVVGVVNILGLIAGPLVAVHHKSITVRTIFPQTLPYFGPYLVLSIITGLASSIILLASHIVIAIIITAVGMYQSDWIAPVQNSLVTILPAVGLLGLALLLTFAPFVLIDQQRGAWHAFTASIELVLHHFWAVVIRLGLIGVSVYMMGFVLKFIPLLGYPLALLLGTIILTAYNYILYQHLVE